MISPQELYTRLNGDSPPAVVDVRSDQAYAEGHVPGAIHYRGDDLLALFQEIPRSRTVVVY